MINLRAAAKMGMMWAEVDSKKGAQPKIWF